MKAEKDTKRPQRKPSRTQKDVSVGSNRQVATLGFCTKAPEWAEHHRLWDDDQPCDDGRSG